MIKKMNVVFYLRKSVPATRRQRIYLRICLGRDRAGAISTGEETEPDKWDAAKHRCRQTTEEGKRVNIKLDRIASKLQIVFDRLIAAGIEPTAARVKSDFLSKPSDFHAWVGIYVNNQGDLVQSGLLNEHTLKTYRPKVLHLQEFAKVLPISGVTPPMLKRYEHWLKTEKKMGNNHAARCIGFLKAVYRHAVNIGLADSSPIEFYTPKRDPVSIPQFLSEQEIERLKKLRTQNKAIQNAQQLFLFQCYTGFAYVDLAGFNPETDITVVRGEKWIMKKRTKSGQLATVPLTEEAEAIIAASGGRLEVPTLQAYNRRLKDLAADMDFRARVTTHLARKTFAVRMLNLGLSYEVVAAMLGHTDTRVTQSTYARVGLTRIQEELKRLKITGTDGR